MDSKRWQQIDAILDAVLDCAQADRDQHLIELCAGDESLRVEITRLLGQMRDRNDALDQTVSQSFAPLIDAVGADELSGAIGRHIGPYRLRELIGRGGMGAVYRAERDDGAFEHEVAIKFIPTGLDSPSLRERFLNERQVLASLQHSHIAQLFDGGVTDDGTPYLVMELIDGEPLDVYCDAQNLPIDARLNLFRDVCSAVQYAHQQLIIHRDIKPDNVLVNSDGVVKLLDFGIARLLDDAHDGERPPTAMHAFTPAYASPEHQQGQRVSVANDVYSLGVLMYKLLCGRLPFKNSGNATKNAAAQSVTQLPRTPSRVITDGDSDIQINLQPRAMARQLRPDLDSIALKALRYESDARYANVQAFIDDIDRYRQLQPVAALSGRRRYRLKKFVKRNRWPLIVSMAVVGSLSIGLVLAVLNVQRAVQEMAQNRHMTAFFQSVFDAANPNISAGSTLSVRELLLDVERQVRFDPLLSDSSRANLLQGTGSALYSLNDFERSRTLLNDALRLRQKTLTAPDWLLAETHSDLGLAHYTLGENTDASRHLSAARDQLAELGHEKSSAMTTVLTYLGHLASAQGETDKALTLRHQVADLVNEITPNDSQARGTALANLAGQLGKDAGQYDKAAALFDEALSLLDNSLGTSHPTTRATRNNFALLRHRQGDYVAATDLYRETLADAERTSSKGSLSLVAPLNNLGNLLIDAGQFEQAHALLERAADIAQRTLKPDTVTRIATDINLAQVMVYINRPDEALSQLALIKNIRVNHAAINRQIDARIKTLQTEAALQQGQPRQAHALISAFVESLTTQDRQASWYFAVATVAVEAAALSNTWAKAKEYSETAGSLLNSDLPPASIRHRRLRLVQAYIHHFDPDVSPVKLTSTELSSLQSLFPESDYRYPLVQTLLNTPE